VRKAVPEIPLSFEARTTFLNAAKEKATTLTHRYGEGHDLLFETPDIYATLLWYYIRKATPSLTVSDIKALCFSEDDIITAIHRTTYYQLNSAVFRAIPPPPTYSLKNKKQKDEKPSFLPTLEDESCVRMYRMLAEKFRYTLTQISELTHYQQYFLCLVLPEEHAARQQMEASLRRSQSSSGGGSIPKHITPPPPPIPRGTVSMSPSDFEEYMANRESEGVT
jgi:hypothetical protein